MMLTIWLGPSQGHRKQMKISENVMRANWMPTFHSTDARYLLSFLNSFFNHNIDKFPVCHIKLIKEQQHSESL